MDIPIAEVTVLEDRAHVVRRATLALPAGPSRILVDGVAPVIADKTLGAKLVGARLVDLRVVRERRVRRADKPEAVAALDAEIDAKEKAKALESEQIEAAKRTQAGLTQLAELTAAEISEDVRWGRSDAARWQQTLDDLGARMRAVRARILGHQSAGEQLARDLADLRRRRAAAEDASTHQHARLVLELVAEAAAVEVELDYVVPGACWRPQHTAEIVDGKLALRSDACVWQSTGEAWTDAALFFSTERPSLGASPPSLVSDVLSAQKKRPEVAVEVREQEIHTAGLGGGGATRRLDEVPGIDDGGAAARLAGAARTTVDSDGRPHRVPLFSFTAEPKRSRVLVAELAPMVFVRTEQLHTGAHPLLSGPVDLIKGGGLVGRTHVQFVAPGERFELSWGPDPSLRVAREIERLEDEQKMLSSWTTRQHRVAVHLSNIGPEARRVEVRERVLVSEVEKVQVAVDPKKTTGQKLPSPDGFVDWVVDVPAFGTGVVKLAYSLKLHSDVRGL